jgi:CRP-like cAMP-binding protein
MSAEASTGAPSVMDIMRRKRVEEDNKDKELEGLWFNDLDIDEAFDLFRAFRKKQMFFDDYSDDDFIHLSDVMYILSFNKDAPITKEGEVSTWAGMVLKGKVNVMVKGTQVASLKPGTIIGDTGFVEGGRRSADCVGAEGGGVIAIIDFEKLDLLYETHSRLAYKLAISLGGSVVKKLRKTMGKVYQKDNESRKGKDVGRRRIFDSFSGFSRDASQLHTLTQKEILYLAKLKKQKRPERQRKLKEKVYKEKIEKENEGLKKQLKGCREELKHYQKREQWLRHLMAVAMAGSKRYEKKFIKADALSTEQGVLLPHLKRLVEELETKLDVSESARKEKFGDMEETINIMKDRERKLLDSTRTALRDKRMMEIKLKSNMEEEEEKRRVLVGKCTTLGKSFEKVNLTMSKQEGKIADLHRKLKEERKVRTRERKKSKIRSMWQSAAARILSKRIHTVRRVAKVHNAWWDQLNHVNLLRFKHMDKMIADWRARDEEKKKALVEVRGRLEGVETKLRESNRQNAAMLFVILSAIFHSMKKSSANERLVKDNTRLKEEVAARDKEKATLETSIVNIAKVAKEVQIESMRSTETIVHLKSKVRAAEKSIAHKNLELYKSEKSFDNRIEQVSKEINEWRGALDTRTLEVKSEKKKKSDREREIMALWDYLNGVKERWVTLEQRFGHLLPKADISDVYPLLPKPKLRGAYNNQTDNRPKSRQLKPLKKVVRKTTKPPSYYPKRSFEQAAPGFELGVSKCQTLFDNSRQRFADGDTGISNPNMPSKVSIKINLKGDGTGPIIPPGSPGIFVQNLDIGPHANENSANASNPRGSPLRQW